MLREGEGSGALVGDQLSPAAQPSEMRSRREQPQVTACQPGAVSGAARAAAYQWRVRTAGRGRAVASRLQRR